MAAVFSDHPSTLSFRIAFFSQHTLNELCHRHLIHGLVHDHLVFLLSTLARMDQMMGKITTIGQQEQPFAVLIKTAHMM